MSIRAIPALAAIVLVAGCGSGGGATAAPPVPARAGAAFVPDGPPARAAVWAVGDGPPGPGASAVSRRIARAHPDVVLYLGDLYPMGTAAAFKSGFARTYGAFAKLTAPTPGNHDWPVHRGGYDAFWSKVHGGPTPPWYSFHAGGWELFSLNSESADRTAQLAWLRSRLTGASTCRLAFWHRPRYSAGLHGDQSDMQPYWSALTGHARLVVSGHDHDMQRMRPRHGLVQYVSGAGGHSLYRLHRNHPRLAFGNDRVYGALRMVLTPGSAQLSFVAASGRVLDASRVSCRR